MNDFEIDIVLSRFLILSQIKYFLLLASVWQFILSICVK